MVFLFLKAARLAHKLKQVLFLKTTTDLLCAEVQLLISCTQGIEF